MKDALGKEIELGRRYGYARNANGVNTIIIGTAKKFTEKGVTLTIEEKKTSVWNDDPKDEKIHPFTANVKNMMLFPINPTEDEVLLKINENPEKYFNKSHLIFLENKIENHQQNITS